MDLILAQALGLTIEQFAALVIAFGFVSFTVFMLIVDKAAK